MYNGVGKGAYQVNPECEETMNKDLRSIKHDSFRFLILIARTKTECDIQQRNDVCERNEKNICPARKLTYLLIIPKITRKLWLWLSWANATLMGVKRNANPYVNIIRISQNILRKRKYWKLFILNQFKLLPESTEAVDHIRTEINMAQGLGLNHNATLQISFGQLTLRIHWDELVEPSIASREEAFAGKPLLEIFVKIFHWNYTKEVDTKLQ